MSVQNVCFHAKWDNTNNHLKTPLPTTAQKVGRIAWNILAVIIPIIGLIRLIGYAIGSLASRAILPAAYDIPITRLTQAKSNFELFWKSPTTDQNRSAQETFNVEEHTVITPDEATLSVKLLRHKNANGSTPTVIYFNPNFGLALEEPNPWFLKKSIELKVSCNFVFFDYRGVGDSKGTFAAAKDLVVDGSSIVQWVQKHLKTSPDHIHFYGKSLGGAMAAQTQALDPERLVGPHLNERSFASSDKMIKEIFGSGYLGKLLAWVVNNQGYGIDAATAFKELQGQKLVVYHPADEVIPYNASLQEEVQHDTVLRLEPKPGHLNEIHTYAALSNLYPHNAPLEWHKEATNRMGQFLFGLTAAQVESAI